MIELLQQPITATELERHTTPPSKINGVVQKIEYTYGGAGNQWTTIDGIRYCTYWDIRTKAWRIGDTVEFNAFSRPQWHGQISILHAENIAKIQ